MTPEPCDQAGLSPQHGWKFCPSCQTNQPLSLFTKKRKANVSGVQVERTCKRCRNLWDRYKITPVQYADMLVKQGGKCAICRQPPIKSGLWVDHCHSTGAVRGLLCKHCNSMIGLSGDNPDVLKSAIEYLKASTT